MEHDTLRETLLTYARDPQNGVLSDDYTGRSERTNPGCGDTVELRVAIDAGRVREVTYDARGCALSTASTALLSEVVGGTTVEYAVTVARRFLSFFTKTVDASEDVSDDAWPEELTELEVFSSVRSNPARAGCVTLPWEALLDLLGPLCEDNSR